MNTFATRAGLPLALTIAFTACAQPANDASAEAAAAAGQPVPADDLGIELFQPRPQLYTAGQPQAGDWAGLAARGITTVINLRTEGESGYRDEQANVRAAGMQYIALPIDGAGAITPENARELSGLLHRAEGPVLVHCASANRSGGLLALMAAQEEGMAADDALAFGRAAGMRGTETRVRELLGCGQGEQDEGGKHC